MPARLACLALALLWLAAPAAAQGFAGLGQVAEGFSVPERGRELTFPEDHGAHPGFRIEWWYVTANLTDAGGRDYGLQWTLFRTALAPEAGEGWTAPQVWMGHAAVTTETDHFVAERLARGGIGQAGVRAEPFEAWIDEWRFTGLDAPGRLTAAGPDFGYDLSVVPQGPIVFHGDNGYSVKSAEGQASYYYSQPYLAVEGVLRLPSGPVPVTGSAWVDREWSSQPLSDNQSGWDWFSLSFDSGSKLMGFALRQTDGTSFTSASWIEAGAVQPFGDGAFAAEPLETAQVAGRTLPVRWRVTLPDKGVDVVVEAINPEAWMDTLVPYWEGPVRISGSHEGRGYLEMTGY